MRKSIVTNPLCGFAAQTLPPMRFADQISHLDLKAPIDRPRQQAAAANKLIGRFVNRRPEPQFRVLRMAVEKPVQLCFGFRIGQRAIGEVAADFWVAVEREQIIEIGWLQVPQDQAHGL